MTGRHKDILDRKTHTKKNIAQEKKLERYYLYSYIYGHYSATSLTGIARYRPVLAPDEPDTKR